MHYANAPREAARVAPLAAAANKHATNARVESKDKVRHRDTAATATGSVCL